MASAQAEDWLDHLADRVGTTLLAAIWGAEFPVLLRSGKCAHRRWLVAGKPTDLFVGGLRVADLPVSLRHRSCWCCAHTSSFDRRDGVHVRSAFESCDPLAEPVSHCNPSAASL